MLIYIVYRQYIQYIDMKDKTLATFRIEPEQWEALKEKASSKGSNASAVLNELVSRYLADDEIDSPNNRLDKDIDNIDKYIDEKLDDIDERIYNKLEQKLGEKLKALEVQMEELLGKLKAR